MPFIEKLQRWIADPPPERLFEITESSLAAGSPRAPSQHRQEVLAERGLTASPSAPNLLKPNFYRDVLPRLSPLSGAKRPATALVIPDYAVRMAILDFQEFPAGELERIALIRFRLRKSVPFHIDEAQLSYAIQKEEPKAVEVLAVAIARPILDEYEALFVEAGYRVGIVIPSCLAALRLCHAGVAGPSLLIKVAGAAISVVLFEGSRVHLVRCLDLQGGEAVEGEPHEEQAEGDLILPLLQQTLAYAEDQLGTAVKQVSLCGFGPETEAFGERARNEFGVPYAAVRSKFGVASQENAGLLGLLERYAA